MDPDVASHMKLRVDDEGKPILLRFVYVDELTCIGCTYCAEVARSTFYMNEDAGRARVFNQHGDEPLVVQEAIDSCPVNCISYVDHEDLVILEQEREGITINPMTIGIPATWSARMHSVPPTKAKLGGSSMVCCNNCPGRGCKECPMFGVGQNPVYLERMKERQAKKESTGEAAKEQFDAAAQQTLDAFFGSEPGLFTTEPELPVELAAAAAADAAAAEDDITGVVVPLGDTAAAPPSAASLPAQDTLDAFVGTEPDDSFFEALYGPPGGFGDDGDDEPPPLGL